jgi:hypothetical protein
VKEDILTERAIAWLDGVGAFLRVVMLVVIYFALTTHFSPLDAGAVTFAFFLTIRALLRMGSAGKD